jgi:UDP-N-acetylmuramoyl-L-alanyl-D-glutamate--2,6-diaminopimelate ligase
LNFMILSELLKDVSVTKLFQTMYGKMVLTHDVVIDKIQYDSRKINRNDLFVALRGTAVDGHKFIQDAIHNGAKAVVLEDDNALSDSFFMHNGVLKIVVSNTRKALAQIAANYYNNPSKNLKMIGVTGTNGKTTTVHIIKSIMEEAEKYSTNKKVGLVGTIENKIGNEVIPTNLTTPESLELNEFLSKVVAKNGSSVVMEVSSHALHQNRVYGIEYDSAVFTNLTQDHLDYHKTMDEYFNAKKILFDNLNDKAAAVSNIDDEHGEAILQSTVAKKFSYGINSNAMVKAENISMGLEGTTFDVLFHGKKIQISSTLIGRFNVYNILASVATSLALNVESSIIQQALSSMPPVRGRFERISSSKGFTVIIDYAHTPDALEKCLDAIHDLKLQNKSKAGKIITVFGAGGDRDKTKRPKMGKIASELSDMVILTSDNPRSEEPFQIIRDITAGIKQAIEYIQEVDRARAIEKALSLANAGDVVLLAGKGHEDYQVIGNERIHFSDKEIVLNILNPN